MEIKDRVMALLEVAQGPVGIDVVTTIVAPGKGVEISAAVLELVMSGKATADARGITLAGDKQQANMQDEFTAEGLEPVPESKSKPVTKPEFEIAPGAKTELARKAEYEPEPKLEDDPEEEPEEEPEDEPEDELDDELEEDPEDELEDDAEVELEDDSELEPEDELPPWPWPEYNDMSKENDPPAWPWHEYAVPNQHTVSTEDADSQDASLASVEDILRATFTEDSIEELAGLLSDMQDEKTVEQESERELIYAHMECPCACLSITKHTVTKLKMAGIRTVGEVVQRCASPKTLGVSGHIASNVYDALEDLPGLFPQHMSASQVAAARNISGNDEYGFDMFGLAVRLEDEHGSTSRVDVSDSAAQCESEYRPEERELVESARRTLDVDGWIFWQPMFEATVLPLAKGLVTEPNPLETLLDRIWAMEGFVDRCRMAASVAYEKRGSIRERLELTGIHFSGDPRWRDVVDSFVESHVCDYDAGTGLLSRHCYTLCEWLDSLPSDRGRMLRMRFEGKTLQVVGREFGVTRERIRQLQSRLLKDRPPIVEDKYGHFVKTYSVSRNMFCHLTGEEPFVFGYLDFVSTTKKAERIPVERAINDPEVSMEIREQLASSKTETSLLIDGKHVPKTKRSITMAILSQVPVGEAISLEELTSGYRTIVEQNEEQDNPSLKIVSHRSYGAWLERQKGVLYAPIPKSLDPKQRAVRLYDHKGKPFSELESYLSSWSKRNIECSARLVYEADSFVELRDALDLRNCYELHTVIRRYCKTIEGVSLGRAPMITFGWASREEQLEKLIQRLGPISAEQLARAYEDAYGVDALLVQMNYLKEVSGFRRGDLYDIKDARLTDEQLDFLASLLVEDINVLRKVRKDFVGEYPDVDPSMIGPDSFLEVGYLVRRNLVVREGFDMRSYTSALLSSHDMIEVGTQDLPEELFKDVDFQAVLKSGLRAFSIVETTQGTYRSMRSLKQMYPKLNEGLLRDYMEAVITHLKKDEVETIHSLRRKGFGHPLHDAIEGTELGDDFLSGVASMGYVGGRLKRTRANGVLVISRRRGSLSVDDFIESVARRCGTVNSRVIHQSLRDDYGVRMSGSHVRALVNKLLDGGFTLDNDNAYTAHGSNTDEDSSENSVLADAIRDCLGKSGRMPVARLLKRLQSQYGITMSAIELRNELRNIDVRFDEARDFVFSL